MHVQIRPYRRAHPQRIADLAALVRYLLEAKDTESDQNHQLRLAGPPVTSRVVQRLSPFGSSVREAAYDLAQQVFNHARESQIAGNLTVGPMYLIIETALEQLIKELEALPPGSIRTINAFEMDPSQEDRQMLEESSVPVRRGKRSTKKDAPNEPSGADSASS